MDKSREQFEEWVRNQCNYSLTYKDTTKMYFSNRTRQAWDVWQASRAAVEIELPQTQYYGDYWSGDWALDKDSVEEVLTEQGLKVKQ